MRSSNFLRLGPVLVVLIAVSLSASAAPALTGEQATKLLGDKIGGFSAAGPASPLKSESLPAGIENFNATSAASRRYQSKKGNRLLVTLITTSSDSSAYALFTNEHNGFTQLAREALTANTEAIGTASYGFSNRVAFVRGPVYVVVTTAGGSDRGELLDLARSFGASLDSGGGEIPVLVKHLPNWEAVQGSLAYAVNVRTLTDQMPNQPILQNISFEGGTEAVAANYGAYQLLLIEFTTPQLAGENDLQIATKLRELSSKGQSLPTAYRRVGNYAVFVFNASNEQSAKEVIDEIQYEQVVQWLGDNPHWLEEAQKRYVQTTAGVFIAVIKASGISLLACLALGGFIGALVFSRRRARQTAKVAFSDAGGMVRLNLDEMSSEADSRRLIGERN